MGLQDTRTSNKTTALSKMTHESDQYHSVQQKAAGICLA